MASELTIFSIYRSRYTGRYVLLRTERPAFPNYSEAQADLAHEDERTRREALLNYVAATLGTRDKAALERIGELQSYPVGEVLMAALGGMEVEMFYLYTEYGYPWIILGTASSEAGFLEELREDEDLLGLRPVGLPVAITVKCFAESDAVFLGEAR